MNRNRLTSMISLLIILSLLLFHLPSTGHADVAKNFETALTKGSYALENGNLKEAIRKLRIATDLRPENHSSRLLLGIALARQGDDASSRSNLLEALRLKPDDQRTSFELGISFLKSEEIDEARDFFEAVSEMTTDPQLTEAARNYLAKLPRDDAGGKFRSSINLGVQHDSNVILEPDDPIVNAKYDSDWRGLVFANVNYLSAPGKTSSGMIGYSFYQSIHDRLSEFDTQQHQLTLQGEHRFTPQTSALILYRPSRTYVDDELYSNFHTFGIGLKFKNASNNRISATLTHDRRKFFNTASFGNNDDRSGNFSRFTLSNHYNWRREGHLTIGYTFEFDKTDQTFWEYQAHQGSCAINQKFGEITAKAKARVQVRDYKDSFPGFNDQRGDTLQEYSINFAWKINESWIISLDDVYTINKSNLSFFEYKRNIFGFFVRATL